MKRREFIHHMALVTGGLIMYNPVFSNTRNSKKDVLKGFIVSDAHFGWDNPVQPAPEKQQQMMEVILKRFPDLDVLIDTGDAHHNGTDRDEERGLWTDIIKNPSNPMPFYYIAGNHEIDHCRHTDPELRCNRMGSVSCRPYYSWDMKGIHFVSMPELVTTVYMNKEILDWVELDLELNKNKTTLLLSHNQFLDTTSGHEPGYRGLLNTGELWRLLNKYPNVKAWMHGHNHNYEMVEKNDVLFVSNGRIGGFDPSRQAHGLGGIYFEIRKDQLIARSYSAEKGKFLTQSDVNERMHPQYHPGGMFKPEAVLDMRTTLNPQAPPAYSYGMGGANTGTRFPLAHHHANYHGRSSVYLGNNQTRTLNEDPDIKYFIRSGRWSDMDKKTSFMGGRIRGSYEWADPNGVKLLQTQKGSFAVIQIPQPNFGRHAYYQVAPDTSYVASVRFDGVSGGQTLQIECRLHESSGREIKRYKSDLWTLGKGDSEKSLEIDIPGDPDIKTIYSDARSDKMLNLSVHFNINTRKGDVTVRRVALELLSDASITKDPVIIVDGSRKERKGELRSWCRFDIPNPKNSRSVCEVHAGGSKRLTWLIRHEGWDWQVRNAAVKDHGDSLEFEGLRNPWTHRKEVVFVPATRTQEPYVFKMRNASKARVFPLNRGNHKLHFIVEGLTQDAEYAEIEIMNAGNRTIQGASLIESRDDVVVYKALPGEEVYVN